MKEKNMYFPYRYLEIIVQKETRFWQVSQSNPSVLLCSRGVPSMFQTCSPGGQLLISHKFSPAQKAVPGTGQMFDKELNGTGFLSQCFDSSCALLALSLHLETSLA